MIVYNSLTRKKEPFVPLQEGKVGVYLCGPTVYDSGHVGHARSAVSFDIIRRFFTFIGYDVTFVSNYTDIDDKMIARANEKNISVAELAEMIIPEYQRDYGAINVLPPDIQPLATEHVPEIIEIIEKLIANGYAYVAEDGVYFEVRKYSEKNDYGKLSHQKIEELQSGARVSVDENKKDPLDFALWKFEKPGEPSWDSPWGKGRPGWHIECSAMCYKHLGETIDIHGGGIDLIFPHHEDEIAQSEGAFEKPFVKYFMHNGFVKIDNEKMSKSLNNFFTIKEILEKYDPYVVRFFLLSTHYRLPINFADTLIDQSKQTLSRLQRFVWRLEDTFEGDIELSDFTPGGKTYDAFTTAMKDDFEISKAIAALFELVKEMNASLDTGDANQKDIQHAWNTLKHIDSVLGCIVVPRKDISSDVEALIAERNEARSNKDFARSDAIRDELKEKGIELEDTPDGTVWRVI